MSFFGFDTTLPRDKAHQTSGLGFSAPQDAFAGLSGNPDDEEAFDFEETYDGLASQLDEDNDAFNDDTFGSGPATQTSIGKDFDFSGQTDSVARAIEEERMRFAAQRQVPRAASPPKQASKPRRTGYESYIPQLEADASIWGLPAKPTPKPASNQGQTGQTASAAGKKFLSLEEVEAELARQSASAAQPPAEPSQLPGFSHPQQQPVHSQQPGYGQPPPPQQPMNYSHPPQILQRRPQQQSQELPGSQPKQPELPDYSMHQPQILQRPRQQEARPTRGPQAVQAQRGGLQGSSPQPRQILQNPNRLSGPGQPLAPLRSAPPHGSSHHRGPSYNGPVITNPQQILQLSDEDRAAFLQDEARRAKRNHKIHLLSKNNGLMTPQDKNFITRIQLQQLVTATGSLDAQDPESQLNEDFYYQVYAQIRGATRQNPNQPASQFAHTYLFQTGGRYGHRRGMRHGDSHLARMEQQVARAVEAAKAKPKNKQLVIEGSLGKISYSNAKTPKPLLNFTRPEAEKAKSASTTKKANDPAAERRATLRDIENVYMDLMKLEDHERQIPPRLTPESDPETIQRHMEWREKLTALNGKLWADLKIMEAIDPNSISQHPFIAMLSHAKGKKAMPRVFRHLDDQQRLTTLTMIFVSLDQLDVVAKALPNPAKPDAPVPLPVREEIDLFSQTVMPALFSSVGESPLSIISGIIGVLIDRTNVPLISLTKIGLSVLTMVLSRAEVLRESQQPPPSSPEGAQDWAAWNELYNRLFDLLEPALPHIFPGKVTEADDVHVWQFLAAMGVGASPEQQQRLVIGVKDRVMETVAVARTLPRDMGEQRLGHVNLFMRAIGLDVELLGG
ncbi:uncharacterized protein PV09_06760 [Verruconis gallopava]|uniref:mRNA decay factor PAT1 domain-containing protein n=1 Tax=Verruconis gallopava TaxID=253628 RepID=A0A0D2ARW4_9PEZI|nr:uncharacterized protein PV09_06760 [Verruconis gallopava]KIW01919.1 hypothetical protein PV09_06760 [Verruconis gallopava]